MKTHTIAEPMHKLLMNLLVYHSSTSLTAPHLVLSKTSELPI